MVITAFLLAIAGKFIRSLGILQRIAFEKCWGEIDENSQLVISSSLHYYCIIFVFEKVNYIWRLKVYLRPKLPKVQL